jgi:CubicO group peptidase (beta-lactamase class C family)
MTLARPGRLVALAVLGLVALAAGVLIGSSREPSFHEPRSVAELAARIERAVPGELASHHVPGATVAIVRDGRVVYAHGFGDAGATTRFQVGSISKPVAAYAILELARARHVSLDARITIAGWSNPPGITLRRLLSHTAGLNVPGYLGVPPGRPLNLDLGAIKPVAPPGTELRYSGGGYTIAQAWAGKDFGDAVLERLGMTHSSFDQTDRPGDAKGHDAAGRAVPAYRYAERAAAGLRATAPDLGRFIARIPAQMLRPAPATKGRWSTGLELETLGDGTRMAYHEGINRGWYGRIAAFPDKRWGIAVLTDGDGGRAVAERIMHFLVA